MLAGGGLAVPARVSRAGSGPRGTGDLGIVIERATGSVLVVETTGRTVLGRIEGLGDLSHASAVFSRDERYAYVFGRDGGLTRLDLLEMRIDRRIVQAGNSIGGAISDDGRLVAASNYDPGGVKVFDADTLVEVAAIPAIGAQGRASKTVGLVDVTGRRFVYTLYDAGEIWIADFSRGATPVLTKFPDAGALPYDANVTGDGRHYLAGLFGEDGITYLDLWDDAPKLRRVFQGYNAGRDKLPVYKMPHFEGWGQSGSDLVLPAAGQNEVLLLDLSTLKEKARIAVHGQPVFCVARPDGREVWINFAHPANDTIQILDVPKAKIVHTFQPGPAVLHLEFTPRGHEVWISVRDADRVDIMDVRTRAKVGEIAARKPSGILFTARAHRLGS
ncbi:MAG: protein nirF [Xanthobacteraceae bacterium]|nr:MAG: protein nirF [Xanthobacteraceae bacterium]